MNKLNKIKSITQKIPSLLIKSRWILLGFFIIITILCCIMIPKTQVKYDLSEYLPTNSDTKIAMDLLKKEFDDKGMAYVMVENVSQEEANQIKQDLAGLNGVANVAFVPELHYKNNKALFTVTLTDYDSTNGSFDSIEGIINALSGREAYLTGQSAFSYFTRLETEESILKLGIVIVIAIILMLLFTSKTYFELVIMIIVFGVAVAINMGTNFMFNGISYISNLVGLVLQLALSLDYSVIMLHRFMEERENGLDAVAATENAIKKGIREIFSSSLTTIAGLCSLLLMTLPIGVEIGLALSKGIVISLLTVIFLMPALLVIFDKVIFKTKHKSFVPKVVRPARAIVKAKKIIVPIFLVIIILAGVGQAFNTYAFNMNGGSKIVTSREKIEEDFGTLNSLVIVVPKGDYDKERELASYIESFDCIDEGSTMALSSMGFNGTYLTDSLTREQFVDKAKELAADSGELSIIIEIYAKRIFNEYFGSIGVEPDENSKVRLVDMLIFINGNESYSTLLGEYSALIEQLIYAKNNLESDNYSRLTFNINSGIEGKETFALIKEIKENVGNYYQESYITGESPVCYEMNETFPRDNLLVNLCSVLFILFILLVTFKNIALPIILILAIEGGIWINFAIPFLAGNSVSFIGYLIISAVQIGATIDYAIVLTNRYLTIRRKYPNRYDAMAEAENMVFSTIITSGIILTITGFALSLAASGVVAGLGLLLGIGTVASMLIVLFILPSLLLVFEKIIDISYFNNIFKTKRNSKITVSESEADTINIDIVTSNDSECDEAFVQNDMNSDEQKIV